ncbi:MAG: adenylate/guanylate cyclase domain-containing protein [Candidatus Binatia bacterium]
MLTPWLIALVALIGGLAWRARTRGLALERRLEHARRELESLQAAFARFAPLDVIDDIIARGVSTRSETKEITVLFADLKGFTALAERLDPARLVTLLNGYFQVMGEAIAAHRGHLGKFIGDGLLAFFGGLEPNPWQTNDALHAALAMRVALAAYNRRSQSEGLPPLAVGIGIHRGPVIAGVLGNATLMEYGVIGRTVNLAARIEELTRVHDVDILVTEAVRAHGDPRFRVRAMPAAQLKGVADAPATFALDGFDHG